MKLELDNSLVIPHQHRFERRKKTMLNTKDNFNQLKTSLVVQELGNEDAAAITGGANLELYDTNNFDQRLGSFDYGGKPRLIHNDQISSIIVRAGQWRLYEHADYKGYAKTYGKGRHVLNARLNNKVSSFQEV
jgi:hypothetical protein